MNKTKIKRILLASILSSASSLALAAPTQGILGVSNSAASFNLNVNVDSEVMISPIENLVINNPTLGGDGTFNYTISNVCVYANTPGNQYNVAFYSNQVSGNTDYPFQLNSTNGNIIYSVNYANGVESALPLPNNSTPNPQSLTGSSDTTCTTGPKVTLTFAFKPATGNLVQGNYSDAINIVLTAPE